MFKSFACLSFVLLAPWAAAFAADPCETDTVNDAMRTLKWNSDGSSKGWQNLNGAAALKDWYANAGAALPNLDEFYTSNGRTGRIQNAAGTKVGYWIDTSSNQGLITPQVLYTLRQLGSDVFVMRIFGKPGIEVAYGTYDTPTSSALMPRTLKIDYPTVYAKVAADTQANGKSHVLLGYNYSTKSVTDDKTQSCQNTNLVENQFTVQPTAALSSAERLVPGEYLQLADTVNGGMKPLRIESLGACPEASQIYLDDKYYVDFSQPSAVDKSIAKARKASATAGLSGLAYDVTVYQPGFDIFLSKYSPTFSAANPNWMCKYRAGLRKKFGDESQEFFVFFNMLEPRSIDELNESRVKAGYVALKPAEWRKKQEELLQYAYGGLVEFFGGWQADVVEKEANCSRPAQLEDVCEPATNFYRRKFSSLLEQVAMWRRNPEKYFEVTGRGPKTYISYREEYDRQNYLHAVYLLGSGPNTAFKYDSTFQFPLVNGSGRTDSLSVFDNQLLDLGSPSEPTFKINKTASGIYWRRFENALVMVYPHDASAATASTSALAAQAPTGVDWKTVPASLAKGKAFIVTAAARKANAGRVIDFTEPDAQWLAGSEGIFEYQGNAGLRVKETSPAYLTDLLLNVVKYPAHRPAFKLKFRLNAAGRQEAAKIVLLAEVDDERKVNLPAVRKTAVFELYMGPIPAGLPQTEVVLQPHYRKTESTAEAILVRVAAADWYKTAATVPVGTVVTTNFIPQDKFDTTGLSHIKFRRWDMLRTYGDFNLQRLQIGDSAYPEDIVSGVMGF